MPEEQQFSELTSDDIIDILSEEDSSEGEKRDDKVIEEDKKVISKEVDDKTKENEEEEEEKEGEDEEELRLKDEEDEDIELNIPVRKKEILKVYPDLFKKFPALETAYYQAQQYREILPTIEDAREAVEKAGYLDRFERDLLSGNVETVLSAVKESSPKSFGKMVDNIIQTISKIDEGAAVDLVSNILRNYLYRAAVKGRNTNNADLETAAKIMHGFVFDTEEVQPPRIKRTKEKDENEEELNQDRIEFERERFNAALTSLQTRVDNTIKATIDANIDKKSSMSAYVKKNAIRDAFDRLETLIKQDSTFSRQLDSMWRHAKDAKYSSSSLERIRAAYLSKAKTLLPGIIKSARNEALKGIGKVNSSNEDRKGPVPAHKASTTSHNRGNSATKIPEGMSIRDFIMAD
jgi:hypothetical protein